MDIINARSHSAKAQHDAGLRAYMVRVFLYMALGLLLTGVSAFVVISSPELFAKIHYSGLGTLVMIAPIGIVLFLSFGIHRLSTSTAQILFWTYSGLLGVSLSYIFVLYTGTSIARIFFSTSGVFGLMAFYGHTTRKDLTNFGSFLFMGLIGIMIASLVNIFMKSSATHFVISILAVIIFTGLTAYDVHMIRRLYYEGGDSEVMHKKAILGALNLYMDFINIFIRLLHLFGDRK